MSSKIKEALVIALRFASQAQWKREMPDVTPEEKSLVESALAEARAAPAAEPVVRIIREKDGSLTAKWGPGYVPTEGDRLFLAPPPVEASQQQSAEEAEHIKALQEDAQDALLTEAMSHGLSPDSQQQASGEVEGADQSIAEAFKQMAAERDALRAEAEALREDAERWKWRRENPDTRLIFAGGFWRVEDSPLGWHDSADDAVDAALASQGSQRSENRNEGEKP